MTSLLGLPHVHSLFWMDEADQLQSGDDVDRVISAELPNKDEDPALYKIVTERLLHGPCGEHRPDCDWQCREHNPKCPCMADGVCSKGFPKRFQVRLLLFYEVSRNLLFLSYNTFRNIYHFVLMCLLSLGNDGYNWRQLPQIQAKRQ